MEETVEHTRRPVRGWVLWGAAYDQVALPDEVLTAPQLEVVVVAGDTQGEEFPWVRATVLVVAVERGERETVSALH